MYPVAGYGHCRHVESVSDTGNYRPGTRKWGNLARGMHESENRFSFSFSMIWPSRLFAYAVSRTPFSSPSRLGDPTSCLITPVDWAVVLGYLVRGERKLTEKVSFFTQIPEHFSFCFPPQAGHLRSGTLKQFYFFFFLSTIGNFNDTDITFPHHYLTESFLFSSSVSVFLWVPDLPRFMGKKC